MLSMRFDEGHESPDLIDRRGEPRQAGGGGGGWFFLVSLLLRTRYGWVILLLLGGYYLFTQVGGVTHDTSRSADGVHETTQQTRDESTLVHFVSFVLDDTQAMWARELPAATGKPYRRAKLVLFTDATSTGCGYGDAATGPFYCPADERVFIDLGFYRQLERRLGAGGDFAQAYVIAHEIGHHVQKILGTSERVGRLQHAEGAGGASVRLELQADCLAGVWAHSTNERSLLENGDIEEALRATAAIGDDKLQRRSTGTVTPETWTHGSSEQRSHWFRRGLETGKIDACDTFSAPGL
jgi:predicted metalloprotease